MLGDVALIFKTSNETQAVVATPQIPELQRQEDLCELKASLVYMASTAYVVGPCLKTQNFMCKVYFSLPLRLHPLGQLKSRLPLQHYLQTTSRQGHNSHFGCVKARGIHHALRAVR